MPNMQSNTALLWQLTDGQIIVGEGRQLLLPGNVYVYDLGEDGAWSQAQVLTPGGERAIGFGQSLAADQTTLGHWCPAC